MQQERDVDEDQCDRHEKDLYRGDNRKPGITTRLEIVENNVNTIKFYGRWMLLLLGGIFGTALAGLVMKR
jgi:hypothetical protein